ncbi:hypothetical protein SO802_021205 [Lithocarpus litseifolius]|uniref:Uncharacterized protein n=1 Tax=Lithocarpus litseifolius TaxID=425828 RepID=A0AAW2CE82_9ROSI
MGPFTDTAGTTTLLTTFNERGITYLAATNAGWLPYLADKGICFVHYSANEVRRQFRLDQDIPDDFTAILKSTTSVRPFLCPSAFELWGKHFTTVTIPGSQSEGICTATMHGYWQAVMTSFGQELLGGRGFSLIPPVDLHAIISANLQLLLPTKSAVAYARKQSKSAIFEWQVNENGWYLRASEYLAGWGKKVKVVNLPAPAKKGSVSLTAEPKSTKKGDDSSETYSDIVPYEGGLPPIGNIVLESSPPPSAHTCSSRHSTTSKPKPSAPRPAMDTLPSSRTRGSKRKTSPPPLSTTAERRQSKHKEDTFTTRPILLDEPEFEVDPEPFSIYHPTSGEVLVAIGMPMKGFFDGGAPNEASVPPPKPVPVEENTQARKVSESILIPIEITTPRKEVTPTDVSQTGSASPATPPAVKYGCSLVVTPSSIPSSTTRRPNADLSSDDGSEEVLKDSKDELVMKTRVSDSNVDSDGTTDIPEEPKTAADIAMPTTPTSATPVVSSIKTSILAFIPSLHLSFANSYPTSCFFLGLIPTKVALTSQFEGFLFGRSTRENFLKLLGSVMNNIEHNFVNTVYTKRILCRAAVQELIRVGFAVEFLLDHLQEIA